MTPRAHNPSSLQHAKGTDSTDARSDRNNDTLTNTIIHQFLSLYEVIIIIVSVSILSTPCYCINITSSSISCTQISPCRDYNLFCNTNEDCSINCASSSCTGSTINPPINGNLIVTCNGADSCTNSNITAPKYGNLSIYCTGTASCSFNEIYSQPESTTLSITAYGNDVLNTAIIYCPENGICSIKTSGNGTGMMDNMIIYTNIDTDLYISCDYTTDIEYNCYTNTTAQPRLYCESDDKYCEIELISGIDNWQCLDGNVANNCTDGQSPTNPVNLGFSTKTMIIIAAFGSFIASFVCGVIIACIAYCLCKRSKANAGKHPQTNQQRLNFSQSISADVINIKHNTVDFTDNPPAYVGQEFGQSARIDTEVVLTQAAMKDLPDNPPAYVGQEFGQSARIDTEVVLTQAVMKDLPDSCVDLLKSNMKHRDHDSDSLVYGIGRGISVVGDMVLVTPKPGHGVVEQGQSHILHEEQESAD